MYQRPGIYTNYATFSLMFSDFFSPVCIPLVAGFKNYDAVSFKMERQFLDNF